MRMIVNQPYTNSANVLSAAMLFIRKRDNELLRLTDIWRHLEDGIALYDSKNQRIVRIGRTVQSQDTDLDKSRYFSVKGVWYACEAGLSRAELNDAIQVLNDIYGDFFIIHPTGNYYEFYLV